MPESVSISVNGESRVPPGFRFHPTEEELLQYYLRKKVAFEKIDLDVIVEVDLNKLEPWDIQEKCKIGSTPQNDWYFFSHKDKKYPTGTRTNRATMAGFWKATGRDKIIYGNGRRIGMRKTLVFYRGRAPHGQKSDWIMHEYRLDDNGTNMITPNILPAAVGEAAVEEGWVVCRIFKKKNLHKSNLGRGPGGPLISATTINANESPEFCYQPGGVLSPSCSSEEGSLEKIFLQQMGGKPAAGDSMKLPSLDHCEGNYSFTLGSETNGEVGVGGWAAIDRMLAAHLNGSQQPPDMGFSGAGDHHGGTLGMVRTSSLSSSSSSGFYAQMAAQDYYSGDGEVDLWSLINRPSSSTASDPLL